MELQAHDLRELAEFFAKRFPSTENRRQLVEQLRLPIEEAPGQPPIQAWMVLLEAAHNRRVLSRLGQATQRIRPFDENLASMTDLLRRSEGGDGRGRLQLVGMIGAALLVVGSTWAAVQGLSADQTRHERKSSRDAVEEDAADPTDSVEVLARAQPSKVDEPDHSLMNMMSVDREPSAGTPVESPDVEPEVQDTVLTKARQKAKGTPTPNRAYFNGRCTIPDDGVVGYWYAGEDAPGEAGEVLVMDHSVNVRADYPDRHNLYDARTSVRCQLASGDTIRLTADPILVPGDRYWVPLYNGDLIPKGA